KTYSQAKDLRSDQRPAVRPKTCSQAKDMHSGQRPAFRPKTCSQAKDLQPGQRPAARPKTCIQTKDMQSGQRHTIAKLPLGVTVCVCPELESLPVFPRECLKLQKLLGSGAFGEVYEGVTVRDPHSDTVPEQRVAVKTLRNGASSQEKIEFLKEAHLMSQFSHPNILRLLGVCVRNEPHYIILELMEGGDLRSYLRGARPTNNHGKLLNLTGLLDISVDVANGCVYLEKLHFVHRDLAARNCLVSVRGYADPDRVIKIGDFGLARDVYKSDYYRKRGEGLLPVRWMPPESLTDGIFNKHSDVWAFGVLLWEIMTLGKQPYPAFSNQEVLHHVNTRGRLPAPAECPQSLYKVMLECWSKEPRERPSFRSLHMSLVKLRETETLSEEGKTGHVNEAYTEDGEIPLTLQNETKPKANVKTSIFSNSLQVHYLALRSYQIFWKLRRHCCNFNSEIFSRSCLMQDFSCTTVSGSLLLYVISSDWSGLQAGQFSTQILLIWSGAVIIHAECGLMLSC
uniref:Tyrosine-protein kinase receptor n=1 Tax=Pygocentrus nattereri TaxID=42514 RepID=A0AAR2LHF4_PYGNA